MSAANAGRAATRRARVTSNEFVQSNECEGAIAARKGCGVKDKEPIDWPIILGILLAVFVAGLWLGRVLAP